MTRITNSLENQADGGDYFVSKPFSRMYARVAELSEKLENTYVLVDENRISIANCGNNLMDCIYDETSYPSWVIYAPDKRCYETVSKQIVFGSSIPGCGIVKSLAREPYNPNS